MSMTTHDLHDTDYVEYRLHEVKTHKGIWELHLEPTYTYFYKGDNMPDSLVSGQTVRLYGDQFGAGYRGLAIDGQVIFYYSVAESERLHIEHYAQTQRHPQYDAYCQDWEFDQYAIEDVRYDNGWWELSTQLGCFGYKASESPVVPQIGQIARYYGEGFGSIVRGLTINNQIIFYRTQAEQEAASAHLAAEHERQKRQQYEARTAEREQEIALLPSVFQQFLAKLRRNQPDKYWSREEYELFACREAVLLATTLGSVEAIEEFAQLPWEEQQQRVPLDEGHSGNTFGFACLAAKVYLTNPERIPDMHAAISPLLGCYEAGCHTPADFPAQDGEVAS